MKVVVIAGGDSSEREVSLRSGAAVKAALTEAGHLVNTRDPYEQAIDDSLKDYDVAFPIIHGAGGEDGQLQQQLEDIGLDYVGSGVAASSLCFDKDRWRQLMQANDVPVARGEVITADSFDDCALARQPYVLKPVASGSTIDTFIVRNPDEAPRYAIDEAFQHYDNMLIEELIEGTEITVGILADQALPVIEIIPPADGEFDYENKYNGASQELCPPQHLSQATQVEAQALAKQIHQLCDCRGMSRTDMIVKTSGKLVVLETNTLPGMTNESLLPKAAAASGLSMSELCHKLVQLAAN